VACQIPLGGSCSGCQDCNPEIFLPAQEPYFGPGQPGGDQDGHEQPEGHPH
jgi:hypothetical protein